MATDTEREIERVVVRPDVIYQIVPAGREDKLNGSEGVMLLVDSEGTGAILNSFNEEGNIVASESFKLLPE